MTDLKDLRLNEFQACVDDLFVIKLIDEQQQTIEYPLKLVAAQAVGVKERDEAAHGRESFSLIFEHERTDIYLQQGIYSLENATLGVLQLFLVPLGPQATGMQYEVIFT